MSFFSGMMQGGIAARFSPVLAGRGLNVLVVHPQGTTRSTLAASLGLCHPRIGRVLEAGSGAEALAQLRAHQVDLVFCSLQLGDLPGVEALRRLGPQLRGADLALLATPGEPVEPALTEVLSQRLPLRGILAAPFGSADLRRIMERAPGLRPRPMPAAALALDARELEEAIDEQRIEVHYHPVVSMGSRRLLGVEALSRWKHARLGLIEARHFMALAERSGLMPALTLSVARQALRQVSAWRSEGLPLSLTLNISTAGIDDMNLPELLLRAAESAKVSPQWVVLELSERQLRKVSAIYGTLSKLRCAGFRLAVEHFGAAEGPELSLLRRLNFTELKIDRSLVAGAVTSERRASLADAVALGRRLDMRVTGAGVETAEDWQVLAATGCNAAQGHMVTRPLAAAGLAAWKHQWQQQTGRQAESRRVSA